LSLSSVASDIMVDDEIGTKKTVYHCVETLVGNFGTKFQFDRKSKFQYQFFLRKILQSYGWVRCETKAFSSIQ